LCKKTKTKKKHSWCVVNIQYNIRLTRPGPSDDGDRITSSNKGNTDSNGNTDNEYGA